MWLIILGVFFVFGFSIRFFDFFRPIIKFNFENSSGHLYGVAKDITKAGVFRSISVAIELKTDILFKIRLEENKHQFYKNLGLLSVVQTGDIQFDKRFYIGSDHKYFNLALQSNANIREIINEIFNTIDTIEYISSDGHSLIINSNSDMNENEIDKLINLLISFSIKIRNVEESIKGIFYKDYFDLKILISKSILWGLFFVGIVSSFRLFSVNKYNINLFILRWGPGFLVGLGIILILFIFFLIIFRSSNRGYFSLKTNLWLIFWVSPFFGTTLFYDLNEYFDKSQLVSNQVRILSREVIVKKNWSRVGRRGSDSRTFRWYIRSIYSPPEDTQQVHLDVTEKVYDSAKDGKVIEILMRNGAFNVPYLISINGINYK